MGLLDNLSDVINSGINKAVNKVTEAAAAAQEAAAQQQAEGEQKPEVTPEQAEQAKQAAEALKGLGTLFTGAINKAKEEYAREEEEKKAKEAAIFENWQETLPAYPVWDVGGSEFELEEQTPMNGYPVYTLRLSGRPFLVEMYASKLRAEGFIAKGCSNPQDLNADTYYKLVDGVCYAFNRSDACQDGCINVSFYVDKYVPEEKKAQPQQAVSNEDLKKLAKSIFKKLF